MLIPGPWSPGGIRPEPSEATWVMLNRNLLDGISRRSDQLSSISHVCCSAARGLIGFPGGPLATCANSRLERWTGKAGSPVCLPGLFPAGFGPTWTAKFPIMHFTSASNSGTSEASKSQLVFLASGQTTPPAWASHAPCLLGVQPPSPHSCRAFQKAGPVQTLGFIPLIQLVPEAQTWARVRPGPNPDP